MVERRNEGREGAYIPPTPKNTKPHGSRDNAVEMAAGGTHERAALEAQRKEIANPSRATDDPGRTDNPLGTGVGYAGEGSAAYGEQEKRMSTNDPKRADATDKSAAAPTRHQPEQQHHSQSTSGQKPGASSAGSQQSTGGMAPTQGTGSTPQSHTARPSSAETGAHHSPATSPAQPSGTHATEANPGTIGGTQDHGTVKTPQGQNVSTPGHGPAPHVQQGADDMKSRVQEKAGDLTGQAQGKAGDLRDAAYDRANDLKGQAQAKMTDVKGQAQSAFGDAKTQAQGRLDTVTGQAQDTLESVRASLQTKTDALKENVTGRTDQLRVTMTGKTDQLAGTVGEKGDQAKQAANEKSTQAGERLTGLAGSLRDKTQTLDADHPVANAATKAADALEQTGSYLQQSTPDDWMGDLKQLISHKPIESVLIAAGLGYMAARAFRK